MLTATLSVHKATKTTSIVHNNRDLDPATLRDKYHDHIDPARTVNNVTFVQEDTHTAYRDLFGTAVEKYNANQQRTDRRIADYYTKVLHDKTLAPQREFLIQVGNVNDFRTTDSAGQPTGLTASQVQANWKQAEQTLTDYMTGFQQRNPQLHVYNAVLHNDEASPHLHINVIPVAAGYKRGVNVRPSFNKALEQQGFARSTPDKHNRDQFTAWHRSEEKALEVALERHGATRVTGDQHVYLPPAVYKAKKQEEEKQAAARPVYRSHDLMARSVSIDQPLLDELPTSSANDALRAENRVLKQENAQLKTQVKDLQSLNARLIGWLHAVQEKVRTIWDQTRDPDTAARHGIERLFPKKTAKGSPDLQPDRTKLTPFGLAGFEEEVGLTEEEAEKRAYQGHYVPDPVAITPEHPVEASETPVEPFESQMSINARPQSKMSETASKRPERSTNADLVPDAVPEKKKLSKQEILKAALRKRGLER